MNMITSPEEVLIWRGLPFATVLPGTPLRIEVKRDIWFHPVNQLTFGSVLPRLDIGMRIAWLLEGWWVVGEEDKVLTRLGVSGRDKLVLRDREVLDVVVDLGGHDMQKLMDVYNLLTKLGFGRQKSIYLPLDRCV